MSDFKLMTKNDLRKQSKNAFFDSDQKQLNSQRPPGFRGRGPGSRSHGYEKPKNIRKTVVRLLGYLGIYKLWIIIVGLVTILATLTNLFIPSLFARALDTYFAPADSDKYMGVVTLVIIIILIAFGNSLVRYLSRFIMVRISQRIIKRIRHDAFSSLMKAPLSYYDEKGTGDTVSRLSNDVELINASLGQTVLEVINSVIVLIGALIWMFIMNWLLAIIVLLFVPIMVQFTIFISKRTREGFKDQQVHLASLNGIIEENISGLKAVKLYNQEESFTEDFRGENDKLRAAGFKAQVFAGILWPFIIFINNMIYLTVIGIGALLFIFQPVSITIGQIAGVSQYARMFIMPISNLSQLFNSLMQGVAGAERVFELIDTPSEYENDGEMVIEHFDGDIEFDRVNFGYDSNNLVIKNLSFKAKRGEIIAIVGPTGGGKTTTISLLNRFYDIQGGRILIDGMSIDSITKDALRKRIGVVLQDTKLFKGTVFENIQYGNLDKSAKDVYESSKLANAHDFISKLPHGYETLVHEGGQNFSQGERQLISIARTILSDPNLLVLDEATSNIDTRTEAKIQDSMAVLMKGRTSIVIAHRLQTIEKADRIIVIHRGELIESGTHHKLLEAKGFYYGLYQSQFEA